MEGKPRCHIGKHGCHEGGHASAHWGCCGHCGTIQQRDALSVRKTLQVSPPIVVGGDYWRSAQTLDPSLSATCAPTRMELRFLICSPAPSLWVWMPATGCTLSSPTDLQQSLQTLSTDTNCRQPRGVFMAAVAVNTGIPPLAHPPPWCCHLAASIALNLFSASAEDTANTAFAGVINICLNGDLISHGVFRMRINPRVKKSQNKHLVLKDKPSVEHQAIEGSQCRPET